MVDEFHQILLAFSFLLYISNLKAVILSLGLALVQGCFESIKSRGRGPSGTRCSNNQWTQTVVGVQLIDSNRKIPSSTV